jgi:peptidoglycan/LPS O-acetylase OafA/YrhL
MSVLAPEKATVSSAPSSKSPTPRRNLQLDFLRGLAILLVLGRHFVVHPEDAGWFEPLARYWFLVGWTGVDLFFVLSGFLIGGLLFSEIHRYGDLRVRHFLIRRGFKIWPEYYLWIAFVVAVFLVTRFGPPVLRWGQKLTRIIPHLVFAQNYTGWSMDQTWSLAVEEHFYIALPLLLAGIIWLRAKRGKSLERLPEVPIVAALLAVGCLAARLLTNPNGPYDGPRQLVPTHLRIDSLFAGVFLAYVFHFHKERFERLRPYRWWLVIAGLALVVPTGFFDLREYRFQPTFGFTVLYIGYGLMLVGCVLISASSWLFQNPIARWITFVGPLSYPVYLWHNDVVRPLLELCFYRGVMGVIPATLRYSLFTSAYILGVVGVGYLMDKHWDQRWLKVRDRRFPSRSKPLA